MAFATSQTIAKYYDLFQAIDLTFTKEVSHAIGLLPQQVFLKCLGEQWPCMIYSSSFCGAKILMNISGTFFEKLKKANNLVNLRYCFKEPDKVDPKAFFVNARVTGFNQYPSNPDLNYITLGFPQKPPDDLIEIMGHLLEATMNSSKRRDDRIVLTPDSMRKMNIATKETLLFVQAVPRKCILRDISFSGAKVIIFGIAKFLQDKECVIRLALDDPKEAIDIKGKVVRFEDVEGRKDLAAICINFDEKSVPMSYKMRINDYLVAQRKNQEGEGEGEPRKGEAKKTEAASK